MDIKESVISILASNKPDVLARIDGYAKAPALYKQLAAAKKMQEGVAPASGSTTPR